MYRFISFVIRFDVSGLRRRRYSANKSGRCHCLYGAAALFKTVDDQTLRTIPFHLGSINQFVDSVLKKDPSFAGHMRSVFE